MTEISIEPFTQAHLDGLIALVAAEGWTEYTDDVERTDRVPRSVARMFDHITLRVPDLAAASSAFTAVLEQLEIEQTTSTSSFSVWGNFALTQTDEQHPIARRVHIAFIAPTPAHVDRFGQAGINAGFADDGPAGPARNTPRTTTRHR